MWDSSPKHFVAKNCSKDYFWSQILLLSARRGRPRRERSQHLRKQIVRNGLFWMGADDCASEKIQTRAGHIYRVTLILWLSWFARTSRLTRAYAMPADGRHLPSAPTVHNGRLWSPIGPHAPVIFWLFAAYGITLESIVLAWGNLSSHQKNDPKPQNAHCQ